MGLSLPMTLLGGPHLNPFLTGFMKLKSMVLQTWS